MLFIIEVNQKKNHFVDLFFIKPSAPPLPSQWPLRPTQRPTHKWIDASPAKRSCSCHVDKQKTDMSFNWLGKGGLTHFLPQQALSGKNYFGGMTAIICLDFQTHWLPFSPLIAKIAVEPFSYCDANLGILSEWALMKARKNGLWLWSNKDRWVLKAYAILLTSCHLQWFF